MTARQETPVTSPVPQTPEPTEVICPSTSPTQRSGREYWMCTRDAGHGGNHEMQDAAGVACATWPQTDADLSRADENVEERASMDPADVHRSLRGIVEFGRGGGYDNDEIAETLGRYVGDLLAAQRSEIHARYEAVCAQVEQVAEQCLAELDDPKDAEQDEQAIATAGMCSGILGAVARIREVSK